MSVSLQGVRQTDETCLPIFGSAKSETIDAIKIPLKAPKDIFWRIRFWMPKLCDVPLAHKTAPKRSRTRRDGCLGSHIRMTTPLLINLKWNSPKIWEASQASLQAKKFQFVELESNFIGKTGFGNPHCLNSLNLTSYIHVKSVFCWTPNYLQNILLKYWLKFDKFRMFITFFHINTRCQINGTFSTKM